MGCLLKDRARFLNQDSEHVGMGLNTCVYEITKGEELFVTDEGFFAPFSVDPYLDEENIEYIEAKEVFYTFRNFLLYDLLCEYVRLWQTDRGLTNDEADEFTHQSWDVSFRYLVIDESILRHLEALAENWTERGGYPDKDLTDTLQFIEVCRTKIDEGKVLIHASDI